ncbi:cobaltochelatase CobT-related protein [Alcaligenes sp. Marseille-Q7550]
MRDPTLLRRLHRAHELGAAVARALTDDPLVHHRQQALYRGELRLASLAPHLRPDPQDDAHSLRGVADSLALRLLHTDRALHAARLPDEPVSRLFFDWLELLRTETLAARHWPGVRRNLRARFERWSAGYHHHGHTRSELGLLVYTVAQMVWSRLNGWPVLEETEDLIESTRAGIAPMMGGLLQTLKRSAPDQDRYGLAALELAGRIGLTVQGLRPSRPRQEGGDAPELQAFALLLPDSDEPSYGGVRHDQDRAAREAAQGGYRVFDRSDEGRAHGLPGTGAPAAPVARATGPGHRRLCHSAAAAGGAHAQSAAPAPARSMAVRPDRGAGGWPAAGPVDQLPQERRLFKQVDEPLRNQCAVTFLLDCSGSMKDQAQTLAVMVDVLARALERSGAQTEVLGFSTEAWNGGRPYRRWLARGKPAQPGRMNEISHRIFKSAASTWRQSRPAIAALLKQDLYREGVDGEALAWACQRSLALTARRRLVYVISDASPMDSATVLANGPDYLDQHLLQVMRAYERQGVEITGIGLGLDLGALYRHTLIAHMEKGLDQQFLDDFIASLAPRRLLR